MKKKFSFLILVFLFLNSFISFAVPGVIGPKCYEMFDQIKAEWKEKELHIVMVSMLEDYGFFFQKDVFTEKFPYVRTKSNHLIVWSLNDTSLIGKIKPGDIVISIGGINTSTLDDKVDYSFQEKLGDKEIIKFLRDGKEFELELPKIKKSVEMDDIEMIISNISDINIKNQTFTAKIFTAVNNVHTVEKNSPGLADVILENLIYKADDGEWKSQVCEDIGQEIVKNLRLKLPGQDIFFENTISVDKNLIFKEVSIYPESPRVGNEPFNKYSEDAVKISGETIGTYKIQNNFKLQSFPFDKQTLSISQFNRYEVEDYQISNMPQSYENMERYIENGSINGWDILGYEIRDIIEENSWGTLVSKTVIDIKIVRQHEYYIYKVLIPILLILMVCWSVVWVDPKELESRLTITIVCLLSLIAYNFVIDSELPKLEYLTVMDWIILVSYFYATIPNFISIISFRLYKKNRPLSNKIENLSKKYGASSYVLIVFIIIMINANLYPENSSAAISWLGANKN